MKKILCKQIPLATLEVKANTPTDAQIRFAASQMTSDFQKKHAETKEKGESMDEVIIEWV